ncbi:MAG TPA: alpha/beta hydrolase [Gemmatimonadaceae bacterium]|jgi:hypothetical protein
MRQVLFIQGAGKDAHDKWDNQLVDSLHRELGAEYEILYPVMPNEDDPKFASWRPAIEAQIASLRDGALVVGHSVGGTMLINTLGECRPPITLSAIILLAAPFIGEGGWKSDDITPRSDLASRLPHDTRVMLYHGEHDDVAPTEHVALYARAIPQAKVRRLPGRDHQFDNNLAEVADDIRKLASRVSDEA